MISDKPSALPGLRQALAEAVAAEARLWRRVQQHQREAQRWERRIVLAERYGAFDLATQAAARARRHAALAQAAVTDFHAQGERVRQLKLDALGHEGSVRAVQRDARHAEGRWEQWTH